MIDSANNYSDTKLGMNENTDDRKRIHHGAIFIRP
jgi:hypothetical protein